MRNKLINLANYLDAEGFEVEASYIDNLIIKLASVDNDPNQTQHYNEDTGIIADESVSPEENDDESSGEYWDFSVDSVPGGWSSSNFSPEDLMSRGNRRVRIYKPALRALNDVASKRPAGKPVLLTNQVNSSKNGAYRDRRYNLEVGGASQSEHIDGRAFDIHVSDYNREERLLLLKALVDAGFTGFGHGRGVIHADFGAKRFWTYGGYRKPSEEEYRGGSMGSPESASSVISGEFPISAGDRDSQGNTRIIDLQNKLIEYGYDMHAGADGVFGTQTESVVREFQGQNSLQETGALSENGYDLLMNGSPQKAEEKRIIVALGDSITKSGYIRNLENTMDNIRTFTFGYGGKGVRFIYNKMDEALAKSPSDIVIMAGVNDVASGRSFKHITRFLSKMYLKAKNAGVRVVAVTILPSGEYGRGYEAVADDVNDWIKNNPDVDAVVDGTSMGVGGNLTSRFTGDGVHLNREGQGELSARIAEQAFAQPAAAVEPAGA